MADTTKITENERAEGEAMAAEMELAQKTGTVDFSEKKEEKEKSGNYTHTFKKPVEIEGQKYTSMTFYFDRLTGEDIEAIEEELQDQNKYVLTPEISSAFSQCLRQGRQKSRQTQSDGFQSVTIWLSRIKQEIF